jgi:hypothetical protein
MQMLSCVGAARGQPLLLVSFQWKTERPGDFNARPDAPFFCAIPPQSPAQAVLLPAIGG